MKNDLIKQVILFLSFKIEKRFSWQLPGKFTIPRIYEKKIIPNIFLSSMKLFNISLYILVTKC